MNEMDVLKAMAKPPKAPLTRVYWEETEEKKNALEWAISEIERLENEIIKEHQFSKDAERTNTYIIQGFRDGDTGLSISLPLTKSEAWFLRINYGQEFGGW